MNARLTPPMVNVSLRITSIRSRGKAGGAVFAGVTDGAEHYAVVSDYRLLPDASLIEKGQVWLIEGPVTMRSATVGSTAILRHEQVINATAAEMLRPTGRNMIDWIANCPDCAGIGQVKARRLYDRFGPDLADLIEDRDLEALTQIISAEAAELLCNAFDKFKVANALLWLDRAGMSRKMGQSVVSYWKGEAQEKIEANPYALISFEADWKKVDTFVRTRLGIAEDDPRRLAGAVEDVLYGSMRHGHTCLPESEARTRLSRLLDSAELAERALNPLPQNDPQSEDVSGIPFHRIDGLLQAHGAWLIESYVARRLHEMVAGEDESGQSGLFAQIAPHPRGIEQVIDDYEATHGITLSEEQRLAVRTSAANHLSLILGGAGTGKTTVLKALYEALGDQRDNMPIYQLALAGRAAQRMAEATQREAMTIAGFLAGIEPGSIEIGSAVVVDEVSMVDVILMYRLLRHIPSGVRLILVGDPSQLPPIGPGLVLHALAELPSIPQTELKVVKRQSSASGIPQVAAAIRAHQVPAWVEYQGKGSGVSFVPCDDARLEDTVQAIYEDLGGNGTDYAVQILSITNANLGGVKNLNVALHNRYQADGEVVMALDAEYGNVAANTLDRIPLCVGDLVIFTENNYKLGLRNGSLGRIVGALPVSEPDDPCCRCMFEGGEYLLDSTQVQTLSHSYSITVHKSQGSQFTRVIVPIRKSRLLDQTLIYTAVTRGVDQVVLVGDLDATNASIKAPATAARRNVMLPRLLTKGLK